MSAPKITPEHIRAVIAETDYETHGLLTICILTLLNGFKVVGHSSPVMEANFDADTGREIARSKAVDQVWMLEGYLLKQRVHDGEA